VECASHSTAAGDVAQIRIAVKRKWQAEKIAILEDPIPKEYGGLDFWGGYLMAYNYFFDR
jgi:hypothetical protein